VVKTLHKSVQQQIEKRNCVYATKANKGRKHVVFQVGDWVWVHIRKERFLAHRKSKLQPRGDGPFQILERINDNAYKVDLLGEYGVSATINVFDLTLFDVGDDLRSNQANDPLEVPIGPITRARLNRIIPSLFKKIRPRILNRISRDFSSLLFKPSEFPYC
jgi:hypothetical protein